MAEKWDGRLEKQDDCRWIIPKQGRMRVPGLVYASEKLLEGIKQDNALIQIMNVADLPGITKYSIAMPDIHWGYGLPIGGVAGMNIKEDGVISPGGVGSDINCGVRLVRTDLVYEDIKDKLEKLVDTIFNDVPSGLGSKGDIDLSSGELRKVLKTGAKWAVERGLGSAEDIEFTEETGTMEGADHTAVSDNALERGKKQLGTLGSGNHFVEVQVVEEIYEDEIADKMGIFKDQVCVMTHTGSRGLGYQVCEDYMKIMIPVAGKYRIELPDKQLACAPYWSEEGMQYFGAMACAANYAWTNRQCITHLVRRVFEKVFGKGEGKLGMRLVYDVAHNIAKIEKHVVDGKELTMCIHRKGATRAFPPGHPSVPKEYEKIGQPVIIPGDMGTCSYVLVGTQRAMDETWGTVCHGAGRVLSRTKALKLTQGRSITDELKQKGILVRAHGRETLGEEVSEAYKDVTAVVDVVHDAGISKKVAKLRPVCVVKG